MAYMMYLGTDAATVHTYSDASKGDAGSSITAQWVSKRLDFTDQVPQAMGRWIALHSVELVYVDRGAVSVTVSVSVDGTENWTDSSATTIGTAGADARVKSKLFFFTINGQFYNFKVTHTSSDGIFQFIELRAEIEIGGEYFNI
ncbi:MAG: hypothetical protein V3V81_08075 [Candidatus Bathyarchaeia archaeon]